jgi:hypothetical protein
MFPLFWRQNILPGFPALVAVLKPLRDGAKE